jgi:hypothetical protein
MTFVLLHDPPGNKKTQTKPLSPGSCRKKRLEDFISNTGIEAVPIIGHGKRKLS